MNQLNISPLLLPHTSDELITVIAGPCSAETERQVLDTASQLHGIGIRHFRAGLWKPRTKPGAFEGVGSRGLRWLLRVKEELGMTIATEVASATHVRQCLDAGVDIFWIGARTTTNPFLVKEIAAALRGNDAIVLVKNPINPDVELWIGAIQRLYDAGVRQIGAIHRGFSSFLPATYRNPPHWQIPIELKRRLPEITILGDPSHIAGDRKLVSEVSRQAMEMHYGGLIIETHCMPDKALSDAAQQITPSQLATLLSSLRIPLDRSLPLPDLDAWRTEIDELDATLLQILAKRMELAAEIGHYKCLNNLPVLQTPRYRKMQEERIEEAKALGLSEDFVLRLFSQIHEESINIQCNVFDQTTDCD